MPCTAPGRPGLHADPHRDPAEAQREADRQRDGGERRERVGRRSRKPIDVAEAEEDHAQDQVARRRRRAPRRPAAPTGRSAATGTGRRRPSRCRRSGSGRARRCPSRWPGRADRAAGTAGSRAAMPPPMRAAEDVDEQQQEDDRLDGDVDQLLGRARGLDQAALGQRQRVAQRAAQRVGGAVVAVVPAVVAARGRSAVGCGHAASSSGRRCGAVPVRVKNTSSRLGRCRDSSVTPMPAACEPRDGVGQRLVAVDRAR